MLSNRPNFLYKVDIEAKEYTLKLLGFPKNVFPQSVATKYFFLQCLTSPLKYLFSPSKNNAGPLKFSQSVIEWATPLPVYLMSFCLLYFVLQPSCSDASCARKSLLHEVLFVNILFEEVVESQLFLLQPHRITYFCFCRISWDVVQETWVFKKVSKAAK